MIARCLAWGAKEVTRPAFGRFLRAMDHPEEAQRRVLERIIRKASASAYGRQYGLADDDPLSAFREKVPINGYESFRPWIERAVFGKEAGILSVDPVTRVEVTSGSSAAAKWIPYTRPALRTFSRMFSLWAHDVLRHRIYRPKSGKLFLCVTGGRTDQERLPGWGVDDDRDYLGRWWRVLLDRYVIVPEFVESDDPLDRLARTLASSAEIEVMSFWSPSLLLSVLTHLGITDANETRRAWPNLQLISCWTAASSSLFTEQLQRLFPEVTIQGKGLLATEGAVTFPSRTAGGYAPLLQDIFLEFEDETGGIRSLHELENEVEYEVILSTEMGLIRYRLGDRVRVDGFYGKTPLLEFLGRAGIVSDLVGEKLTLVFIERVIRSLVDVYFCLLPLDGGYELWIDSRQQKPIAAEAIDERLRENIHYDRALRLAQLRPLRISLSGDLSDRVQDCTAQQKGTPRTYKPPLLIPDRSLAHVVSRELQRRRRE